MIAGSSSGGATSRRLCNPFQRAYVYGVPRGPGKRIRWPPQCDLIDVSSVPPAECPNLATTLKVSACLREHIWLEAGCHENDETVSAPRICFKCDSLESDSKSIEYYVKTLPVSDPQARQLWVSFLQANPHLMADELD
jgi:hypothetical protein